MRIFDVNLSDVIFWCTFSPVAPDAPPANVTAVATSPYSINISWSEPTIITGPTFYLIDISSVSHFKSSVFWLSLFIQIDMIDAYFLRDKFRNRSLLRNQLLNNILLNVSIQYEHATWHHMFPCSFWIFFQIFHIPLTTQQKINSGVSWHLGINKKYVESQQLEPLVSPKMLKAAFGQSSEFKILFTIAKKVLLIC